METPSSTRWLDPVRDFGPYMDQTIVQKVATEVIGEQIETIQQIACGTDSYVFRVILQDGSNKALKVFDPKGTGQHYRERSAQFLERYQELTNGLSEILAQANKAYGLEALKDDWKVRFEILPIENAGATNAGQLYTVSTYIDGQNLDEYFRESPHKEEYRLPKYPTQSKVEKLETIGVPVSISLIHFTGYFAATKERCPIDDLHDFLNNAAKTKGINITCSNIKAQFEPETKTIVCIITDIGGEMCDLEYLSERNEARVAETRQIIQSVL